MAVPLGTKLVLRRFAVKNDKPSLPSDATLVHEPREIFPHVLDSAEGKMFLKKTPPAELRERFACWINDAKTGRHAILYVISPDTEGHLSVRAVPSRRLHAFHDDIEGYDWAGFGEGHVPPCDNGGTPLFDPRFVSIARKNRTKADNANPPLAAGTPPKPNARSAAAAAASSGGSTEAKPSAAAAPKRAVAAKSRKKAVTSKAAGADGHEFTFDTKAVRECEEEAYRMAPAFSVTQMWAGHVGVVDASLSGMAPINARTGKVPGIGEVAILCQKSDTIRNHRGRAPQ
jgi:hypothetical protein